MMTAASLLALCRGVLRCPLGYILLAYQSSTSVNLLGMTFRERSQRTRDDIQPPTSCIESMRAATMAKSRDMDLDATPMTLYSDDTRNTTSYMADNDCFVSELG
jgi:hypothetical protein